MSEPTGLRKLGGVFDGVAEAYDAARPGYPPELVDAAIREGSLTPDSRVLEIGPGTGKLTELLVGRGLQIHAIEPGANLVEAARRRIGDAAPVEFEIGRFEDAEIADGSYDAVFSATAFHWVEPSVGWAKVARALAPGGLFALLTHVGVEDDDPSSIAIERELVAVLRRYVENADELWKLPVSYAEMEAGARARSANAAESWDWLMNRGRHGLAVPEAAALFTDVRFESRLERDRQPVDAVIDFLRTTSLYFMIEDSRRPSFEADYRALVERHGGVVPYSDAVFLQTARRASGAAPS